MEKSNDNVINMEAVKTKEESLKRKARLVKDIAVGSALSQLADEKTYQYAAVIGLYQGLKYRGSLAQGVKGGLAAIVVFAGSNVVMNIVKRIDDIKNA